MKSRKSRKAGSATSNLNNSQTVLPKPKDNYELLDLAAQHRVPVIFDDGGVDQAVHITDSDEPSSILNLGNNLHLQSVKNPDLEYTTRDVNRFKGFAPVPTAA